MLRLKETKALAEEHSAISIVELRKTSAYKERAFSERNFIVGSTRVRLIHDRLAHDWYLELVDRGTRCRNSAITLLRSHCNYGGYREWFECPKCSTRVGVLYLHEDNFSCRKCLDLRYWSQRMNYRTLVPIFKRWAKFEKMDREKCRFYSGKPTRYTQRYEKLREKVEAGMELFGRKYAD